MNAPTFRDLDYLTTRLHARRSLMAEAKRLDELCLAGAIVHLGRAFHPESIPQSVADFQQRAVQRLLSEFAFCLRYLSGADASLVFWLQTRFQLENIKVLLRGFVSHAPYATLQQHFILLSRELAFDAEKLLKAGTLDEFAQNLPNFLPCERLRALLKSHPDEQRLFLLEAALDAGYFTELLARTERICGEEKGFVAPLMRQEVDTFLLMLVVRGKFHHHLSSEELLPLHIQQSSFSRRRFRNMLAAPDISTTAGFALGAVMDEIPTKVEAETLETLAWKRFRLLANRAFRHSHLGLGAVIGYLELRRVELANLITISEGVRLGAGPEAIRARLIPRTELEPAYV